MARGITVELKNRDEINRKISELKDEKPKRAVRRAMYDLQRRGPTVIARFATQTYAISAAKLNPNTKSGRGNGKVFVSGDILDSVTWTYKGERLDLGASGSFRLTPASAPGLTKKGNPRKVKTTTTILKGNKVAFGMSGGAPHSEGGAYGPKSPWMVLPNMPHRAFQRLGKGIGEPARGLSVPQMVLSVRTKDELREELERLLEERVTHALEQELGS